MPLTTKTKTTDLHTLFNNVKEVYYYSKELTSTALGTALEADMEWPVLGEGVSFNSGEAEKQEVKLTNGSIWTTKANKGDSDISMQVGSIDEKVNKLMMDAKGTAITGVADTIIKGKKFNGQGYSLAPKKIEGSLIMFSEDRNTVIALPKVECYGSLVLADGEKPAYFNVKVTPLENADGADIIILWDTTTPA